MARRGGVHDSSALMLVLALVLVPLLSATNWGRSGNRRDLSQDTQSGASGLTQLMALLCEVLLLALVLTPQLSATD